MTRGKWISVVGACALACMLVAAACSSFDADNPDAADGAVDASGEGGGGDVEAQDGGTPSCGERDGAAAILAKSVGLPVGAVADEKDLYWIAKGNIDDPTDGLWHCSLPACADATHVFPDTDTRGVVMDAKYVYVGVGSNQWHIVRYDRASGGATTWYPPASDNAGSFAAMTIDDGAVYAAQTFPRDRIEAIAKEDAGTLFTVDTPDGSGTVLDGIRGLAVTADSLYVVSDNSRLGACSRNGCASFDMLPTVCVTRGFAVDESNLWIASQCSDPAIRACPLPRCDGGMVVYHEPPNAKPQALVVAGEDLYWVDTTRHEATTCKKATCGMSRRVIGNSPAPTAIVATACDVYWTDRGDPDAGAPASAIYRVAR